MFKFSAVSQIWKKYIQKLNDWDLPVSSWLAEQEDRDSIPGLATLIFRDWLSPVSKSIYGWKLAKSTLIL